MFVMNVMRGMKVMVEMREYPSTPAVRVDAHAAPRTDHNVSGAAPFNDVSVLCLRPAGTAEGQWLRAEHQPLQRAAALGLRRPRPAIGARSRTGWTPLRGSQPAGAEDEGHLHGLLSDPRGAHATLRE